MLTPMIRLITLVGTLALVAACSPAAAPAPQTPVTTGEPADPGFSLVAGGDVLVHPELTDQASSDGGGTRDYRPLLAGVRRAVSAADLAICHLETPLAPASGPFKGYPDFSAPPEIVGALADTGYDDCSTASNHTLDMGPAGVTRTLDTLDAGGIRHTGSARSAAEAATPLILDVHGVKVGHVAFSFGFNGRKVPADKPWLANTLDADSVLAAARRARAAGAEIVVASLHWGTEYQQETTAEQRGIAQRLLADPAVDLIIGHHAHVVQPFEKINGKWVAYGMGNLVARHSEPRGTTEEGVLARFHFTRSGPGWTVDRAEYLPTLIDLGPPIRLLDLTDAPGADPTRTRQALSRTDGIVLSRGAGAQGLTRP
ncbi:MAG TPA: CapA family protein [Amycolatopsis sp.]|uniref:CapA family protein n=1 Tax=Amycolatopsis sp. TaxID=37632 RepID=UPI002B482A15|nr:CapA family protein [Amycolatopsis sp.]HKS49605.1 CapA family protein [Amycolatopsis sp.]